jgi:hypothetical protein
VNKEKGGQDHFERSWIENEDWIDMKRVDLRKRN